MYIEIIYMSGTILKHFTEVKSCNPHSNPLRYNYYYPVLQMRKLRLRS